MKDISAPTTIFDAALRCPHHVALPLRKEKDGAILECIVCGNAFAARGGKIFFSEPPADVDHSEKVDPTDRSHWTPWRWNNFSYLERRLSGEDPDKILIDVGAGRSSFRALTKGRFRAAIGVDFFPYECVDVITDITTPLPFADQSCDIIVVTNVLEHLPDPDALLAECYRMLKPDGYIVGTVPFLMPVHQEPYDFLRYTHTMLEQMLRKAGFVLISVESLGRPYDAYATLSRLYFDEALSAASRGASSSSAIRRGVLRVGRKTHATLLKFLKLVSPIGSSLVYTEGYGFTGWRR